MTEPVFKSRQSASRLQNLWKLWKTMKNRLGRPRSASRCKSVYSCLWRKRKVALEMLCPGDSPLGLGLHLRPTFPWSTDSTCLWVSPPHTALLSQDMPTTARGSVSCFLKAPQELNLLCLKESWGMAYKASCCVTGSWKYWKVISHRHCYCKGAQLFKVRGNLNFLDVERMLRKVI